VQRWQISVAPSQWFQHLCFAAALLALLLLILGLQYSHFSWLLAGLGLCLLALNGQRQRHEFFTIDANGRGIWGASCTPFMLCLPTLSTPWLLMLHIRMPEQQHWVFIWQDSVGEDNWCRLRRIAKTMAAENTLPMALK